MQVAVPPIRVIKPGTFTSVEGKKVTFSLADLEAAAAAYDPENDPAPLVIGHPTLEAPAYGWAKSLRVEDGHLIAEPDPAKLEPAFAEAVRAGRYRKVSGRFYQPDSPHNPRPGTYYLQHIGFLGASAPAVKGLGTVNFADAGEELVTIDQPGGDQSRQETQVDKDTKDEVSFAERETALNDRETALAAKEADLATREAAARAAEHDGHVAFAEGLVASGKLAPAAKELVVGLLDQLGAGAPSEGVSFGEGNSELAPAAALRKLLEGAQPLVSFGEIARPDDEEKSKGGAGFAAPPGYEADPKSLEIHQKAVELQAKDSGLAYIDAVKRAGG